ncbi:hypothetical protein [Niabella aquatica]
MNKILGVFASLFGITAVFMDWVKIPIQGSIAGIHDLTGKIALLAFILSGILFLSDTARYKLILSIGTAVCSVVAGLSGAYFISGIEDLKKNIIDSSNLSIKGIIMRAYYNPSEFVIEHGCYLAISMGALSLLISLFSIAYSSNDNNYPSKPVLVSSESEEDTKSISKLSVLESIVIGIAVVSILFGIISYLKQDKGNNLSIAPKVDSTHKADTVIPLRKSSHKEISKSSIISDDDLSYDGTKNLITNIFPEVETIYDSAFRTLNARGVSRQYFVDKVKELNYQINGIKKKIVILGSYEYQNNQVNICHPCHPLLTLIRFRKDDDGKLYFEQIEKDAPWSSGSWGTASEIKIVKQKGRLLLKVFSAYGNFGESTEVTTFYDPEDFKQVGNSTNVHYPAES